MTVDLAKHHILIASLLIALFIVALLAVALGTHVLVVPHLAAFLRPGAIYPHF